MRRAPVNPTPMPAAERCRADPRWRVLLLGLALVAAVLLTYQPAWDAGFIWDDDEYVTHNLLLTAPDGLQRIWFSTDSPSQYFPLVYTNFRLQRALWGLDPAGYHWVNLLLHALNALLVWRLLSKLAVPGAWIGAAIFALHPLQVESVAWITELKNVQSLFFSLITLLAWERFTREEHPSKSGPRWGAYAAALLCHALALFSKTTACTLPAGLVLLLWIQHRPLVWKRWLQIAPFVLLGLVMGLVSVWWEQNQQGTTGAEFDYSAVERLLIATRALCFYFGKLLWPHDLAFSYELWTIDAGSPAAWAWFLPLLATAAAVWALRRRLGRGPEAALVFFAASLLPLLGFFMLYTFRYTFVADHYVYVAMIGPAALAGAAIARLSRLGASQPSFLLPASVCAGLLATLTLLSWRQSHMYEDLRTLWETTVQRTPTSFMAHNNLGALQLQEGEFEAAVASFERALALKPNHTHALANLANAYLTRGNADQALALFRQVADLSPQDAKAQADLGHALEIVGRAAEAEAPLRRAVALDDQLAEGHFLLGRHLLAHGRPAEAAPSLERAVALHPEYSDAHYHLGLVRLAEGRHPEAEDCFRRTIAHAPNHAFALNNLGLLLAASGSAVEAEPLQRLAIQLQPQAPAARHHLGRTLLALDRKEEAVAAFQAALTLAPDYAPARMDLAQTQIELSRYGDAAATLQSHLAHHPEDFEARHGLGRVLLAAGRTNEAAEAFRRVLAAAPDHAEALADLQRVSAASSAN